MTTVTKRGAKLMAAIIGQRRQTGPGSLFDIKHCATKKKLAPRPISIAVTPNISAKATPRNGDIAPNRAANKTAVKQRLFRLEAACALNVSDEARAFI